MNIQNGQLRRSICLLSRQLNKDLLNKNHSQYRLINTYILNDSKLKSIPNIKYKHKNNLGNFSSMSNRNSNKSNNIPVLKEHVYSDNGQSVEELFKILKQPHPDNNIPDNILAKLGRNLHQKEHHPLNIIKTKIEKYCNEYAIKKGQTLFNAMDNICPLVDTFNCFDLLRVASDNVCRSKSDTYYNTDKTVSYFNIYIILMI
jgi:phenylalanyl-tRNA synthetase alpha subunit